MSGREEMLRGSVFRLAPLKKDVFPPGFARPLGEHFRPSEREKELGRLNNEPPLVSVWDTARTSVAQAQAMRASATQTIAFKLDVETLRHLSLPDGTGHLRVLRDPVEPDLEDQPGSDGHCGIVGLGRPAGLPRAVYKSIRSRVADLAVPHT